MSIYDDSTTSPVIINFNSEERISGSNSYFTSTPINLGINTYDSVAIIQAQIPRTFYNVPSTGNTFTIVQNGVVSTVTLTAGTYNKYNLLTELQTKLNTVKDAGRTYTVTYPSNPDTYKYVFSFTGGTGNVSFIFTNSLYAQLGFDKNSTNTFSSGSLTSTNCINLSYINKVFIRSDIVSGGNDDILMEIMSYGSCPMLSLCYYQQQILEANIKTFSNTTLNSWRFSLTDIDGNIVDLNGIGWSFALLFFQRSDTHQLFKNELLMNNEERLFRIQQQQQKIKSTIEEDVKEKETETETEKQTILNDSNIETSTEENKLEPIYPVLPYGSSSIVKDFL